MNNLNSPANLWSALTRLKSEIPALIEMGGENIQAEIFEKLDLLKQCRNFEECYRLRDDLIIAIAPYPEARNRLRTELMLQNAIQRKILPSLNTMIGNLIGDAGKSNILVAIAHSLISWNIDEEAKPLLIDSDSMEVTSRGVVIAPGGINGGKSVKFQNVRLDIGELSEIGGVATLAGYEIIDKPHVLVIAAGILLTIQALTKAMTIEITEQESSVFWGFIQAQKHDTTIHTNLAFDKTNLERRKYGLKPLNESQFRYSLASLENLKCIRQVSAEPRTWLIVEKYKINE